MRNKVRKINRKRTVARKTIADTVDRNLAEYKDTCEILLKTYKKGSSKLIMALDNARIQYLRNTVVGKELRISRRLREVCILQGAEFLYPSNWSE